VVVSRGMSRVMDVTRGVRVVEARVEDSWETVQASTRSREVGGVRREGARRLGRRAMVAGVYRSGNDDVRQNGEGDGKKVNNNKGGRKGEWRWKQSSRRHHPRM